MTTPALLLGFLIATLLGAGFHLLRGGKIGKLFLYILLGWAGFWIGHFAADFLNMTFGSLGQLHLGMAIIGSFLLLIVGSWLSLAQVDRN